MGSALKKTSLKNEDEESPLIKLVLCGGFPELLLPE